jgi:hypothetical protein
VPRDRLRANLTTPLRDRPASTSKMSSVAASCVNAAAVARSPALPRRAVSSIALSSAGRCRPGRPGATTAGRVPIARRGGVVRASVASEAAPAEGETRMISVEEKAGTVFPTNLRCALQVRRTPRNPVPIARGKIITPAQRLSVWPPRHLRTLPPSPPPPPAADQPW